MDLFGSFFAILACLAVTVYSQTSCRVPQTNEQGLCVPAASCKYISDLLLNSKQPYSPRLVQHIKERFCGKIDGKSNFCCAPRQLAPDFEQPATDGPTRVQPMVTSSRLSALNANICGLINTDKIAFGENATVFELPWMALLEYNKGEYLCGGSLISSRYVLTAAHCVDKSRGLQPTSVRLGEHNLQTDKDCEDFRGEADCADPVEDIAIEKIVAHPSFTRRRTQNDIALVRLSRDVVSKRHIKPICLPTTPDLRQTALTKIIAAGWGLTEKGGQSAVLQKATVPVKGLDVCQRLFQLEAFTSSQMCAGGEKRVQTCKGDSGSPLFFNVRYKNRGTRYVQFALVSSGSEKCGGPNNYPGVYTNVAAYVDWIADNIEP